ncbi:serine/threonine-protein kinase AFC2 isoform X3 [Cryptomeria japonica]|uniref:serine/threonine-protein kinase AFC2 isoform X3 n=1 Tax=Cryptomeria japonica TaxID=3369 RepID=UPI0027DA83E3|nr:serine/threonine-protein kinase AFC2 isoform X3 [Cryptomeria japonica]
MACVAGYPLHNLLEEHPKKRRKLTSSWDVLPSGQKAQNILNLFGQTVSNIERDTNGTSALSGAEPSEHSGSATSSQASSGDVPYQHISPPWRNDDKEGHYQFALGDNLTSRYKILSKMGEGTFGQVLECWDRKSMDHVAIKVTRGLQKYREEALIEIDVLREVGKYDKSGKRCVQMREWFDYRNHTCIKGTKRSAEDNLMRLPKSGAIKLIDFGSTVFEDQDHTSVISTRHYRAPEVILGLGWNYPCDIWSVGCMLVELCTGETLFQTHENLEHLAMMERVLGPLPRHMLKKADSRSAKYFRHGTRLDWPEAAASRDSIRAVRKLQKLGNLIMQHVDHSGGLLIDLLKNLLKFEPSERLTAREALRHPFFGKSSRKDNGLCSSLQ